MADRPLSIPERETYLEQAARNPQLLDTDYDIIIVHDPQPLPLRELTDGGHARWIWRCHIDTSERNPEVWDFIHPCLTGYDAAVFTMPQFVPSDTVVGRVEIIPPAIDPESPKNFTFDDGADPDVSVATNLTGVGDIEVNACQRVADVVIQKSIREGFGLVVSEAMWKSTPVVAGRAGGIPLQMEGDVGGLLIESATECAERMSWLLRHAEEAVEIGRQGQARVRQQFLLPGSSRTGSPSPTT